MKSLKEALFSRKNRDILPELKNLEKEDVVVNTKQGYILIDDALYQAHRNIDDSTISIGPYENTIGFTIKQDGDVEYIYIPIDNISLIKDILSGLKKSEEFKANRSSVKNLLYVDSNYISIIDNKDNTLKEFEFEEDELKYLFSYFNYISTHR